jgi:hypothetical protein
LINGGDPSDHEQGQRQRLVLTSLAVYLKGSVNALCVARNRVTNRHGILVTLSLRCVNAWPSSNLPHHETCERVSFKIETLPTVMSLFLHRQTIYALVIYVKAYILRQVFK